MHVCNSNKRNGLISQLGNVAANTGAKVETDPSINPASPGWTTFSTNSFRFTCGSSIESLTGRVDERVSALLDEVPAPGSVVVVGWEESP